MPSHKYFARTKLYREALQNAEQAWSRVQAADDMGVYASADILFREAIFGRDSIEAAEDLLQFRPEVVRKIIFALARLQGLDTNPVTEEEPGKIHHEYRKNVSTVSPLTAQFISNWGAVNDELHYFGAVDATPLFVRLVLSYVKRYGSDILAEKYVHKRGIEFTLAEAVEKALGWIEMKITSSSLGLVEYKRSNPKGIQNQIWTDSVHSTIHVGGDVSNFDQPIAPVEVQGYAYDALSMAAGEWLHRDMRKSSRWSELARTLRDNTIKNFWMEEEYYFALGIDRDKNGNPRKIKTTYSSPGLLLDSSLFEDLPKDEKMKYLSALIRTLFSSQFITYAGIRNRALKYANLLRVRYQQNDELLFPYTDYQGSKVVWFKQTYDIAKGLRRYGFVRLAEQLEARIYNTVNIVGGHYEFVYVDEEGYILIPHEALLKDVGDKQAIYATNIPERDQAWTLSALLAILSLVKEELTVPPPQEEWVRKLEKDLLATIPNVRYLRSKKEVEKERAARTRDAVFVRVQEDLVTSGN